MATGIAGYAHVNICVTDLEAAREFYEDKLGLEQLPRPDFGGFGGYWFRLGPSQLHLSAVGDMPDWKKAAPHMALHIDSDVFETTIEKLRGNGVDFTMDIRQREDFGVPVKTAFCRDPAGNLIELTDVALF
ncbi:MAG TPA: VOC family protein [Acidimicrobiales bacterium]|jgi:catechol 2,3-dioxygenase-like lactoylglutathione lyase family enzyme|nr:VOC family protein [Acidimicrobiales bacterium]